ncbi:pumilio homolog 12-like isoform X2 [Momordica charantia]|uniref:Pumilio homolog 12-like isoform X2 n=1 Tax=Momordica charantia TaxID=3673 RepID=A0A6J1D1G6_MOMCH|nr:pumilio homolog 12-like isoform X2 [Momordica charantia]
MEEMGTELEFDDLARLIGDEIPNVGSGNAHSEEKSLSSMSVNSYGGPSFGKLHRNGNLMDGNIPMSRLQQSPMDQILTRQNTMPGNQSLTFAFEKLSLGDEAVAAVKGHAWKSVPGHAVLLDDHYSDNLNKQFLNMDASMLAPWSSSNHLNSGVHDPYMTRLGIQNSPSRHVPEQYKKWQFPVTSHRQQIYHNGRSPLRYIHPQQVNQRQIGWEEEQFYRIQEQHPYLQHLHNQQLECLLPIQPHENITSRTSCQNRKQQYFEVPISHHLEQSDHEPSWKTCAFHRGPNQLSPVFSTHYMDTIQGMEKISFPRKILARNHGLNTVDAVRFVSIGADKSPAHVNQSRIVRSNSCIRHNNLAPATECICHDHLGSSALYSDSANFKLLPDKLNSVNEVRGKIYLMAKDQYGCRFLQRKFVEGTQEDIEKIFNEIIDHVVELMTDAFGNYLVQKLLEVCNEDQRMQILHKITRNHGELVIISCDVHGTRAIQKVIETLKTPEQIFMIVSSLKSGIVTLMKNINGNHVAQHCLEYLMPGCSELLFDAARNSCVELATDRHGCCVLQKCLSCSDTGLRDDLISVITRNVLVISQDQYGNYVVQFILKIDLQWATDEILEQLAGSYGDLSMQKYSSNVVEKCLQVAKEGERLPKIVNELIKDPRFDKIMQDPYGNYAIQTALNQSEGPLRAKLVDAIRPHIPVLRTSPYGKKVLAMVGKSN